MRATPIPAIGIVRIGPGFLKEIARFQHVLAGVAAETAHTESLALRPDPARDGACPGAELTAGAQRFHAAAALDVAGDRPVDDDSGKPCESDDRRNEVLVFGRPSKSEKVAGRDGDPRQR